MKLAWLEQVQKNPIFPLVQSGFFGSACLILYMPVSYYFPREWNTVIFLFCIYMLEKTISRSISRQLFCQNEVCFTMLLHLCAELFCIFLDQRSTFFFFPADFCLGGDDILRLKSCGISGGISDMQNPGSGCSGVENQVYITRFLKKYCPHL